MLGDEGDEGFYEEGIAVIHRFKSCVFVWAILKKLLKDIIMALTLCLIAQSALFTSLKRIFFDASIQKTVKDMNPIYIVVHKASFGAHKNSFGSQNTTPL